MMLAIAGRSRDKLEAIRAGLADDGLDVTAIGIIIASVDDPASLAAMARTATRLVDGFELAPRFAAVEPLAVQIGGVARSQDPCVVALRRRLR